MPLRAGHWVDSVDFIAFSSDQVTSQLDDLIYPDQIAESIGKLSACKAAGSGGPHPTISKPLKANINEPLAKLFSMSLEAAALPLVWKAAGVVSIHKGGSKKDAENYRPTSLLQVMNKLFEMTKRNKVVVHLVQDSL
ncbi:hypothetical protein FGIG_12141 [Fasciola gigantica]|uniref:Uncharacterized protein n=1 Tax=Fasciola gigantica TaxID=46835 RepID=A0A504YQY3_FASGI|nr:hypothetical protein FGIG_12141 [Fasciola gigantica]